MPCTTLDEDLTLALVSAAAAAPSLHNVQPWYFRASAPDRTIHVHAAPGRLLPRSDPDARAVHLSVGAALCNLAAAAVRLGREPVVRLLPEPSRPGLLASVRLAGRPRSGLLRRPDLHRAVWRRRSSRLPFEPEPVPEPVLSELRDAVRLDGAELRRPGPFARTRLLELTARAEQRLAQDPARRAETLACLTGPGADWGLPRYAVGPLDSTGRLPLRGFAVPPDGPARDRCAFEADPQLLLLTTRYDGPAAWLHAGLALQHALLLLTLHGVRASMLHQALEWPDLRARMSGLCRDRCVPQMLLRVGYGPAGFPTPRRAAAELLGLPAPLDRPAATVG
ncbi:Acg family FMN-binding oxidoreductase [Kitasatospora terrestris]|uniref:Nitroreductase family protein n=1 Tax=Kitasatospora terrestris TaxID=258051 RepID=A0ABP9EMC2_9ACTN